MELIPVLSTIILVATITTFILAIGAYILYKIRERRGQTVTPYAERTVEAELVSPSVYVSVEPTRENLHKRRVEQRRVVQDVILTSGKRQVNERRNVEEHSIATTESSAPEKFMKYTSEGYISAKKDQKTGALKWR
jgi:flagellar basal body-associated protein FliL